MRGFRVLFLVMLGVVLFYFSALLIFRWVPIPTSAFIHHQNTLHETDPKVYSAAKFEWVDWEQIPPALALAVITAEDQRFPNHWGVDLIEIRNAISDMRDGKPMRGASTITQQVAKNLFLWNGRSYVRKAAEFFISFSLELVWSKQRILEVYLNVAQFAPVTFGVKAASKVLYDKEPLQLTLEECAMLAAVLPTPAKSNANEPSETLQKRHAWILEHMEKLGGVNYLKKL
ncbi:monofunctional biosynthetic peptidoglycan transglycosylase [Leucothrix pacifica]|uniref:Biosynthetic peptidoglycan transglycosylase n=2 Tax=Leucothrix pacifica TaxID=1247513 RepID=A0A317CFG9_9GAMM|nr:monofunctional biosynthetic peptidoglycan transglycosylase [Leucothrix pacifica]